MGGEDDYVENGRVMHYIYIIIGFISLISFAVVLTPVLFPRMRRLIFLRILTIISLCDGIVAISWVMNVNRSANIYSLRNDENCKVQAILNAFSYNAGFFWLVGLSIQLYSMITYSKPYLSELQMHIIFWTIPILLIIIPLFVGIEYGMDDYYPSDAVFSCYYRDMPLNSAKKAALIIVSPVFTFIGLIILIAMYYLTKKAVDEGTNRNTELAEVVSIMKLYPLGWIFLLLPGAAYFLVISCIPSAYNYNVNNVMQTLECFSGIVNTCIYFYSSKQARQNWYTLLTQFSTNEQKLDTDNVVVDSEYERFIVHLNDNDFELSTNHHVQSTSGNGNQGFLKKKLLEAFENNEQISEL